MYKYKERELYKEDSRLWKRKKVEKRTGVKWKRSNIPTNLLKRGVAWSFILLVSLLLSWIETRTHTSKIQCAICIENR